MKRILLILFLFSLCFADANISNIELGPPSFTTNDNIYCSFNYTNTENLSANISVVFYAGMFNSTLSLVSNTTLINVQNNEKKIVYFNGETFHGQKIKCEIFLTDYNKTYFKLNYIVLPYSEFYFDCNKNYKKFSIFNYQFYYPVKDNEHSENNKCYNNAIEEVNIGYTKTFLKVGESGVCHDVDTTGSSYLPPSYYRLEDEIWNDINFTFTTNGPENCRRTTGVILCNSTNCYSFLCSPSEEKTYRAIFTRSKILEIRYTINNYLLGSLSFEDDNYFNITLVIGCDATYGTGSISFGDNILLNERYAKRIDYFGKFPESVFKNIYSVNKTLSIIKIPFYIVKKTTNYEEETWVFPNGSIVFYNQSTQTAAVKDYASVFPSISTFFSYWISQNTVFSPEIRIYETKGTPYFIPISYSFSQSFLLENLVNTPTIFLYSNNCYFVPPYSPSNLSLIQTLTAYNFQCNTTKYDYQIILQKLNLTSPGNATQSLFNTSSDTSKYGKENIIFGILLVVAVILMLMNNSIVAMLGGATISVFLIWIGVFSIQFGIVISLILILLGGISLISKR